MFGFRRKSKASEERATALLGHLVEVVANAYLGEKTEADMERLSDHLATDLEGADADTVRAALGFAVIIQGAEIARDVERKAREVAEQVRNDHQTAAPAATDLLPDDEPLTPSEAEKRAQEADEKVWAEDRR